MTPDAPLRVLLVTDAFPPVSGGSGWSTYELARGLRARGDDVSLVRPRPGAPPGLQRDAGRYDGFTVHEFGIRAPAVPFVRNYVTNERLTAALVPVLRALIRGERRSIVHAQHLLSTPAAVAAARAEGVPAVATVRDYWPVCYWSDLIHDRGSPTLCPACSAAMMTRCVRPHAGAAWPLALPAIPYMRANLSRKRRALAGAAAVIAVSHAIGADLRARAPELAGTRIEIIPNPLDLAPLDAALAAPPPAHLPRPYAVFAGKLAPNKGTHHLVPAVVRAGLRWPLVVVGDGPDRAALETAARREGIDLRVTGWLDRGEALRVLAHAALLVFPSHGPESLSRVLLEATALGVAVAAMDTGGTRDIIIPGETGLLSETPDGLGADVARLIEDETARRALGRAALARTRERFAAPAVVARVTALYRSLLAARPHEAARG